TPSALPHRGARRVHGERLWLLVSVLQGFGGPRDLHSFPTRRSSDLDAAGLGSAGLAAGLAFTGSDSGLQPRARIRTFASGVATRSEEHTSELQSRENLVCRLLLVKKQYNSRGAPRERLRARHEVHRV